MGLENYLQVNQSNPDLHSNSHSPVNAMAAPQPPSRQQYPYPASAPPTGTPIRFIDNNPRPAKSPRHIAPPELPSNAPNPYPDYGTRFAPPYNGTQETSLPTRDPDYFPTPLPLQSQAWTTAQDTQALYGTATTTPAQQRGQAPAQHYEFPSEQYVKEEPHTHGNYTWNPA